MIHLQFTGLFLDPRLSYNMRGTLREVINAHREILPVGYVVIRLDPLGYVWRLFSQNRAGTWDILARRSNFSQCSDSLSFDAISNSVEIVR